jgi:hypothetical protein
MKKIVFIFIASIVILSCSTPKKIFVATTADKKHIYVAIPATAIQTSIDNLRANGSVMAKYINNWNGYKDGVFYIFMKWDTNRLYKDVYQEKGIIETGQSGSKNLLISEFREVNGCYYYINASKDELYRIRALTYFGRDVFLVLIECKEKDFPEAQKKLMEIIETLKVE